MLLLLPGAMFLACAMVLPGAMFLACAMVLPGPMFLACIMFLPGSMVLGIFLHSDLVCANNLLAQIFWVYLG
jgi:hypothetical protein